jgi:hypothetical protein
MGNTRTLADELTAQLGGGDATGRTDHTCETHPAYPRWSKPRITPAVASALTSISILFF